MLNEMAERNFALFTKGPSLTREGLQSTMSSLNDFGGSLSSFTGSILDGSIDLRGKGFVPALFLPAGKVQQAPIKNSGISFARNGAELGPSRGVFLGQTFLVEKPGNDGRVNGRRGIFPRRKHKYSKSLANPVDKDQALYRQKRV
jgi:hypothetical protein